MLRKIKKMFIKCIGYSNYRKIFTGVMRFLNCINEKILYGDEVLNVKKFSVEKKDTYFGYYDIQSLSNDKSKLLSMAVDKDSADVGYFDVQDAKYYKVGSTLAWNWQMGSRLRWFEDGKSILFNDYDGEDFISRIVDLNGNEIRRYSFPIYDFDNKTQMAYYTDFTILHHLREGYGYSNKKINFKEYYTNSLNGVFVADMKSGQKKGCLITIDDLKKIKSDDSMDNAYHYINHITVNPYNGDIMFFHLWTNDIKTWKARMIFMSPGGQILQIIDNFDRPSHYAWKDNEHMLVSVMVGARTEYRLYNYVNYEEKLEEGIKTDGHPVYINSRYFLTDTYPNRCAMQSIYVCDSKLNTYKNVFSIYHSPKKVGVDRCDLHPRYKDNLINIDTVQGKYRCQYMLELNCDKDASIQWNRQLLLDKNAVIEDKGAKHKCLLSQIASEYRFCTGRKKANIIKMMQLFMFGPSFRANVYANYMKQTKGFKRKLIRNHLETKYSMIIDQRCELGEHFSAEHSLGIVIGPGVVAGDYLKIYQNVTLGQKNGKFPKIGNYVTIYPGAKIIGGINIGDYAVIGANAVVTQDVPARATAVGIPARNIERVSENE